jgi:hypothetical protein
MCSIGGNLVFPITTGQQLPSDTAYLIHLLSKLLGLIQRYTLFHYLVFTFNNVRNLFFYISKTCYLSKMTGLTSAVINDKSKLIYILQYQVGGLIWLCLIPIITIFQR